MLPIVVIIALLTLALVIVSAARYTADAPRIRPIDGAFNSRYRKMIETLTANRTGGLPAQVEWDNADGLKSPEVSSGPLNRQNPEWLIAGMVAGASDGVISAFSNWHSVDPSVFQAASQSAHQNMQNLLDLSHEAHLEAWKQSDVVAHSLAGHVGEFLAAQHLQEAGLGVEMAHTSNQAGWDAIIGSHTFVNFKDYASFNAPGIAEHFARYPDIPIVVPGDIHGLPADALHVAATDHLTSQSLTGHDVIALDAWHHADAYNNLGHAYAQLDPHIALQNAEHLAAAGDISGAAHALDVTFPFVTLALSGYREGKLFANGDTGGGRALMNTGIDVASVGAGVTVGHWVGGAIGTVFAPGFGTVIGGIAGGVVGGVIGRLGASAARTRPLRQAAEEFEQARDRLLRTSARVEEEERATFEAERQEIEDEFAERMLDLQDLFDSFTQATQIQARRASTLTRDEIEALLQVAQDFGDQGPYGNHPRLLPAVGMRRWAYDLVWSRDQQAWQRKANRLAQNVTDSDNDPAACFDLVLAVPGTSAIVDAWIRSCVAARTDAYTTVLNASDDLLSVGAGLRQEAVGELDDAWNRSAERVKDRLRQPVGAMETAYKQLEREARAAGKPL